MNKILIAFVASCIFATGFAEEKVQILPETKSVTAPYEPATSRGTAVGINLLYVTGGSVVTGAIAAAIIASGNIVEQEDALSN